VWGNMFESGVYQFKRNVGRYDAEFLLYYHDGLPSDRCWLVADFTGLRFVSNYFEGLGLETHFNAVSGDLWIPENQCWPYIYERCLILCSGLLPRAQRLNPRFEMRYYARIPQRFLDRFASPLLDLHITETQETHYV